MYKKFSPSNFIIVAALFGIIAFAGATSVSAQVAGAVFTTNAACTGTNINIYESKAAVYLDGGPRHPGAAGLPDGLYYVQVTTPNGTLLGTTVGTTNPTPVSVVNGEFQVCYQLWAILRKASNAGPYPVAPDGYDTTTNPGGEYKVWASKEASFTNSSTKTDNFKVDDECTENCGPQEISLLHVRKFYDANTNGTKEITEPFINGWKIGILSSTISLIRFTPVDIVLDPDTYAVSEFPTIQSNWINTTPTTQAVTLANGDDKTVTFGNVCLGAGGGLTLGFWSNRNGAILVQADDLALLTSLNLRNADGSNFDPANYTEFRTWLLSGNAVNMAYMLSVQLTAMELNVLNGKVNGNALIYAPGLPTVAPSGFASVNTIMAAANTELGLHSNTTSGQPGDEFRSYQEALKNALDRGNNNLNFVQSAPCPFTFAD